jgi:3-dehydroquinate dehydratase type I
MIKRIETYQPDLIEIRIDFMKDSKNLKIIREATEVELIATNRKIKKQKYSKNDKDRRQEILLKASTEGFDYIDLDMRTPDINSMIEDVQGVGTKLILSHHNFHETPSIKELKSTMQEGLKLGAHTCKIIGMTKSISDNLTYLKFLAENFENNLVSFGMGRLGALSRIFSTFFGGAFTYSSAQTGKESAPGQITIKEMREIYRILGE